jgi:hypothetical protein
MKPKRHKPADSCMRRVAVHQPVLVQSVQHQAAGLLPSHPEMLDERS